MVPWSRAVLAGFFLLIIISFVAGCLSYPAVENTTATVPPAVTQTPAVEVQGSPVVPAPATCPSPTNASYWICIDPIGNVTLGDLLPIRGTTNLPVNDTVTVTISTTSLHPCAKSQNPAWGENLDRCYGGLQNRVTVKPGESGKNSWDLWVNTSLHGFQTGEYILDVTPANDTVLNQLAPGNFLFFTVYAPEKFRNSRYIHMDPPVVDVRNNMVRFSGTASTADTHLQALPVRIVVSTTRPGNNADTIADWENFPLTPGTAGYSWNYTIVASGLGPGNYSITLTTDDAYGSVSDSADFDIPLDLVQSPGAGPYIPKLQTPEPTPA